MKKDDAENSPRKGISALHDEVVQNERAGAFLEEIIDNPGISTDYLERLQYLLSISHILRDQRDKEGNPLYTHIGGYAVLAHLVRQHGDSIHKNWRTSHDLDVIFFNPSLMNLIKGNFEVEEEVTSHLINKKSFKLRDPEVASALELDAYFPGNNGRIFINSRDVSVLRASLMEPLFYGVPISIPSEHALLDLKLDVGYDEGKSPRPRDVQDIFDLTSVYALNRGLKEGVVNLQRRISKKNIPRLVEVYTRNTLDMTARKESIGAVGYKHVYDQTKRFIDMFLKEQEAA